MCYFIQKNIIYAVCTYKGKYVLVFSAKFNMYIGIYVCIRTYFNILGSYREVNVINKIEDVRVGIRLNNIYKEFQLWKTPKEIGILIYAFLLKLSQYIYVQYCYILIDTVSSGLTNQCLWVRFNATTNNCLISTIICSLYEFVYQVCTLLYYVC